MADEPVAMPPVADNITFENTYLQKPEDYGEVRSRRATRTLARDRPPRAPAPARVPSQIWNGPETECTPPSPSPPPPLPQGYKFMRGPVQKVLTDTIRERMEGTQYDPLKSAQIAKELADMIKERVKNLGYDRYKLVVQVTVGEKTGQALRLASRCLWDTATDNFASDFYENSSVFCVGMVFGLYYE